MKGIAHFAGGIAAASFFPAAVSEAASGNPVHFIIGGAFALLPDTLDFKFSRYFCEYDIEIAPDPRAPDARMIAEALSHALSLIESTDRKVCVKLQTVRRSSGQWLPYTVRFRRDARRIEVSFGAAIDSGGNVVGPRLPVSSASAVLPCDLKMDYEYEVAVGFLEGPTIRFQSKGEGIEAVFLHWHRSWSHSLLVAVCSGLFAGILIEGVAGMVAACAVFQHVLLDQLGFMGSNILFPVTDKRKPGLGIAASGDPVWNLGFVWVSCAVTVWNLGVSETVPAGMLSFAFWACAVPVSVFAILLGRRASST